MVDIKVDTLLAAAEKKNFTRAAEQLSLTQPAVSHHINRLERDFGVQLFIRKKGELLLTKEGEIAVKYAKRMKAMDAKMRMEIEDAMLHISKMRIGVTHTSESNLVLEVLTKYSNETPNISIMIITDTIKNLYTMLENFEIDVAIVEGKNNNPEFNSIMLDTDYLVCVLSNTHPLAEHSMITLPELKRERLILRLPTSETRKLFEETLANVGESIGAFDVSIEVENIATIKDLVKKNLGVSILARSVCMDELRKKKITVLPIENLSMVRETNIIYHKTFSHTEILRDIAKVYNDTARNYKF